MEPAWGHGATAGPRGRPGRRDDVPAPRTAEILDRDVGRTTRTINLRGVFPNPGSFYGPASS